MEVKEKADIKQFLKAKKSQLTNLLKKPLFPKNYSGKFLNSSHELSLDQNTQRAIDVMKKAIEEYPKLKKRLLMKIPKKKNVAVNKRLNKNKNQKKLK